MHSCNPKRTTTRTTAKQYTGIQRKEEGTEERRRSGAWRTREGNGFTGGGGLCARIAGRMMNEIPLLIAAGGAAGAGLFSWGAFASGSQLFGRTMRHTG